VATGRLQLITAITLDGHPVRYIRSHWPLPSATGGASPTSGLRLQPWATTVRV